MTSGPECTEYIQTVSLQDLKNAEGKHRELKHCKQIPWAVSLNMIAHSRKTFIGPHALALAWLRMQ